jgi:hypothetical protein
MYEKILTQPEAEPVSVSQLCAFGRFDIPSRASADYALLGTFISAAREQVETMSAQACLNEEVLLTFDFFPNQQDPRNFLNYQLSYAYNITPWWWFGFPQMDSIELVRRPVLVPSASPVANTVTIQYNDTDGTLQTLDSSNYTVQMDKICLNVGSTWPLTDRRQDCIQITYWAGYSVTDLTKVPARLQLAILFLANHFWENRSVIAVEPTSEVALTLKSLLQPYRSMRIPR